MYLEIDKLKSLLINPTLRGKNVLAVCPWCSKKEFYVSIYENHLFQCWRKKRCGVTGNIFVLLEKLNRYDLFNFRKDVDISFKNRLDFELKKDENEEISVEIKTTKPPIGFKRIYSDDYILSRTSGDRHVFHKYQIGISNFLGLKNYIIVLIERENEVKGYISRIKLDKYDLDCENKKRKRQGLKEYLRYNNSVSEFSKLLFGYDEIVKDKTETIIIVEGIFDKWNVDKLLNLDKNDQIKCIGSFKCGLTDEQIVLLQKKNVKNLVILYDPDVMNKIKDESLNLTKYFNVNIAFIKDEKKDPATLYLDELVDILQNTHLPLDFYRKKVQIVALK